MMKFGIKEILSEYRMNDDYNITEDDGNEYVNVNDEIFNTSDRELLVNVAKDYKEEMRDDDEITTEEVEYPMKHDEDKLETQEGNITVDIKEFSEAILKKPRKLNESEINDVILPNKEAYVSSPALQLETLDTENILDNIVKARNQEDGGNEKPASKVSSIFNSIKEPEVDSSVLAVLLMYHDVGRL